MIRKLTLTIALVLGLSGFTTIATVVQATAESVVVCTTTNTCKEQVAVEAQQQTAATISGPKWGPPSPHACAIASREQEENEARCRSYDRQPGGKTLAQCAKCYRQAVFDAARWERCRAIGEAPPVPREIYRSIARLGGDWVAQYQYEQRNK